ncbi:hypothetical protein B0A48_14895 [Cryoendolithus antarcticus]|uniref:Ima1 N-terminal domain-containing protein n=1 Tax=Cryoendolithus antarcticus TaxID=1507870 RepID=A0A1V8SIP8_9PEZI|nr:hypothetical protein B0A48_14895 [Cryoendolithus antarcticus]
MDLFRRRLYCHYCNTRSSHPRSTPIPSFDCSSCGARNHLDARGNITDPPPPPPSFSPHPTRSFESFSRPASILSQPQQSPPETPLFCATCQHNQQIFTETLANYLPDDADPQYAAYEQRLPQFKKELEARYPQICVACAPRVQMRIHGADRMGLTEEMARTRRRERGGGRVGEGRDSWAKCAARLAGYVPVAIITGLILWWWHHDEAKLYDAHVRYEKIDGKGTHLALSLVTMAVRTVAYRILVRDLQSSGWSWAELVAAHSAAVVIILVGERLRSTVTKPRKWRLDRKIMPTPDEADVLGQNAGPAAERQTLQAASSLPFDWSGRKPKPPFPVEALSRSRAAQPNSLWSSTPGHFPPSPPASDETFADEDAMDIDPITPSRQLRSTLSSNAHHSQGWNDLRSNVFDIDNSQLQNQQIPHQQSKKLSYQPPTTQSPFRGRLPAAPMSMERRLRNPVSQVPSFQPKHVSQQSNFLDQMKSGLEVNRPFLRPQQQAASSRPQQRTRAAVLDDDDDEVHSPAVARTRGNLELRKSDWCLPQDTAGQATGLEDLLGGASFRISEEKSGDTIQAANGQSGGDWKLSVGIVSAMVALGAIAGIEGLRRPICLAIVAAMESIGM